MQIASSGKVRPLAMTFSGGGWGKSPVSETPKSGDGMLREDSGVRGGGRCRLLRRAKYALLAMTFSGGGWGKSPVSETPKSGDGCYTKTAESRGGPGSAEESPCRRHRSPGSPGGGRAKWHFAQQLAGAFVEEDDFDGFDEDEEIHPDGPALDVFIIELGAAGEGGAVAAGDLPEAGDAGGDLEVILVGGAIAITLVGEDGAGANQAHFATQDVPELGELVQAEFAQEFADTGDTRVVFKALIAVPFLAQGVIIGQGSLQKIGGMHVHGAEFKQLDNPAVPAKAFGAIEDAPGLIQADGERQQAQERRKQQQPDGSHQQINAALDELGAAAEQVIHDLQAEHAGKILGLEIVQTVIADLVLDQSHMLKD